MGKEDKHLDEIPIFASELNNTISKIIRAHLRIFFELHLSKNTFKEIIYVVLYLNMNNYIWSIALHY